MPRQPVAWALVAVLAAACGAAPASPSPGPSTSEAPTPRVVVAPTSSTSIQNDAGWARIYPDAFDVVGAISDVAVGPHGIAAVGSVEIRREVYAWAAWTSRDGLTWDRTSLSPPEPGKGDLEQVVATQDGFLAISNGKDGVIGRTSADGVAWAEVSLDGFDDAWISDVTAAGPGFVAVGTHGCNGSAWLSTDGTTWSRVDLPDANGQPSGDVSACVQLKHVRSTRFGLVALGDSAVWTSIDGRAWEKAETPEFSNVDEIVETASGLLAVGRDTLWTSGDGRRWQRSSEPSLEGSASFVLDEISSVRGALLATGVVDLDNFDAIWRSTDGIRWTSVLSDDVLQGRITDIVDIGGRIVAIGSADLQSSSGRGIPHPAVWVSPAPPEPVITPTPAPTAGPRSIGELTWERLAEIPGADVWGAVGGTSGFAAFGETPDLTDGDGHVAAIWTSTDGRTWTGGAAEAQMRTVTAIDGGGFVAIESGFDGTSAWSSADGRTWRRTGVIDAGPQCPGEGSGPNPEISAIAANATRLVAVGSACDGANGWRTAAWSSSDGGATWVRGTDVVDDTFGQRLAVTADDHGFTAVGEANGGQPKVWSSPDGLTWTSRELPSETYAALTGVTDGPAGLVAVGTGSVWTLRDGIAWIRPEQPGYERGGFEHVLSDGRTYYAWGESPDEQSTALWLSLDGRSWGQVGLPGAKTERVASVLILDGRLFVFTVDPNQARTTIWTGSAR